MTDGYTEALEARLTRCWGAPIDRVRLSGGRIHELPDDFVVLVIPHPPSGALAHVSCGMSRPDDARRLELFMLAAADAPRRDVVELVTMTAHFHRTGAELGVGHTVNFGRPWLPGSHATRGLLSIPHLDGEALEWCEPAHTRFLWMIAITEAELRFKTSCGLDALEQRFDEAAFNYLDPDRPSVVAD